MSTDTLAQDLYHGWACSLLEREQPAPSSWRSLPSGVRAQWASYAEAIMIADERKAML
jgi:hypothetical protein